MMLWCNVSGYTHCPWVQTFAKDLKRIYNLFTLLENKRLEMFSKRERRKSKHKFGGTTVRKAEEVRKYFGNPKIENEAFG